MGLARQGPRAHVGFGRRDAELDEADARLLHARRSGAGRRALVEHQAVDQQPLFFSWRTEDFRDACAELLAMYQRELEVKRVVVANAAHCTRRELSVTYSSLWVQQAGISCQE